MALLYIVKLACAKSQKVHLLKHFCHQELWHSVILRLLGVLLPLLQRKMAGKSLYF